MASVENSYNGLGDVMEKTRYLIELSQQMKESVSVFSVLDIFPFFSFFRKFLFVISQM